MRDLVTKYKREKAVRKFVGQMVRQCPQKDYLCYAQKTFEYCRDKIHYVFDPNGVELIERPGVILEETGVADCDSIVVTLASVLESMGMRCEFVTIKADTNNPDLYTHVYLRCFVPKRGWVSMDATMHDKPFGWAPPGNWPKQMWAASNDAPELHGGDQMAGLDMLEDDDVNESRVNTVFSETPYDIPGVEATVGVAVGHKWQWQQQRDALIVSTPEQIELETMQRRSRPEPSGVSAPEFFIRDDATEVLRARQSHVIASSPAEPKQIFSLKTKKTLMYAGAAFLVIMALGK